MTYKLKLAFEGDKVYEVPVGNPISFRLDTKVNIFGSKRSLMELRDNSVSNQLLKTIAQETDLRLLTADLINEDTNTVIKTYSGFKHDNCYYRFSTNTEGPEALTENLIFEVVDPDSAI